MLKKRAEAEHNIRECHITRPDPFAVPTLRLGLSRGMSGLELQAHGAPGISCQLLRASRLPGPWLPADPVTFTSNVQLLRAPDTSEPAQFYRLLRK